MTKSDNDNTSKENGVAIAVIICAVLFGFVYLATMNQIDVNYIGNDNLSTVIISPNDGVADALVQINFEHHETHEGDHYFIKSTSDVAATVSYLMFITPNSSKRVHARAAIQGEAEFLIEIYEGANISNNGTPLLELNNDRDSNKTALLEAFAGPTVVDPGLLIWSTTIGSNKDATVAPGQNYEIIAKTNTAYVYKITKVAVGTQWLSSDFWWYEHTPSNI